MQSLLFSLIRDAHRFSLGKLYEGIYWNDPDADLHLKEINVTYLAVKTAIDSRYNPSTLPATADVLRRMAYILDRLQQWIDTGTLFQNDDAEVFLDAISEHWLELAHMLTDLEEGSSDNLDHHN